MTLKDDFAEEMDQTFKVYPWQSNDGKSDTFGTAVSYDCYVEYQTLKTEGMIIPLLLIFCDASVSVSEADQVEFAGKRHKVGGIEKDYDDGAEYSKTITVKL